MFRSLYNSLMYAAGRDPTARNAARAISLEARLNKLDGELKLLTLMVAANVVLTLTILLRVFSAG